MPDSMLVIPSASFPNSSFRFRCTFSVSLPCEILVRQPQIVFRAFPIPFENHSAPTAATAVLEMDWQISSTEVLIEEAALITVFSYFCIMAAAAIL